MRNLQLAGTIVTGILLLVFLPGCGKSSVKKNDMAQLGMLYLSAYDKAIGDKKLVSGKADLKDAPNASADDKKVVDKVGTDYEMIWDVDIGMMKADGKELGDYILGYEKDAATEGGFVVYCDGVVKKLSAEEFKSAKKAEPRKK